MELEAPIDWMGSLPEYLVYRTLIRLKYREDEDFTYQSPPMRGRPAVGFYFPNLNLAINVQSERETLDVIGRAQLEGVGVRLVYIDEDAALRNAGYYVREALRGISHSKY